MSDSDFWSSWFAHCPGNNYFLKVPLEFMDDEFNLTGLSKQVTRFREALEILLDLAPLENAPKYSKDSDKDTDDSSSSSFMSTISGDIRHKSGDYTGKIGISAGMHSSNDLIHCAMRLYGLIHARYVLSRSGIQHMASRILARYYGSCPRVLCGKSTVCPVGLTDSVEDQSVKLYCLRCNDVYQGDSDFSPLYIDGAYFSTSLPQLLELTYPALLQFNITEIAAPSFCRPIGPPPGTETNITTSFTSESEYDVTQSASSTEPSSTSFTTSSESESDDENQNIPSFEIFEPRVFGFRLHPTSKLAQTKFWLRWTPELALPPSFNSNQSA